MPLAALTVAILNLVAVAAAVVLIIRLFIHITRGQTKELTLFAWAMGVFAVAWLLEAIDQLPQVHQGVFTLVFAPFGIAWFIEHLALIVAISLTVMWSWHYISLRLLPQFYLSVVAIGLTAFVLSTVIFIAVLFNSASDQALESIEADVKTFALALSELKDRTAFTAAAIAAREGLITAAQENNAESADSALGDPITTYKVAAAYVLNTGGELIITKGAESAFGVSFAADPVAKRALAGEIVGSALLEEGAESPTLVIRAGSPLVQGGKIVGAVMVDTPLDTAFVDRVGEVTGLDVTIFAQEQRAATTLRDDAGRPLVPAQIEDPALADIVLNQGEVFKQASTLASRPYFIAALPITNVDEARIGVLTAGLSAQVLIDNLQHSTRTTFLVAFGLLAVALFPFYLVAKFLAKSTSGAV